MTVAEPAAPGRSVVPALPDWAGPSIEDRGIGACLKRLDDAIAAAATLGVSTANAEAVRSEIGGRLGFPADSYVLALVGGTGVGKSSLLNALAGTSGERRVRPPADDRAPDRLDLPLKPFGAGWAARLARRLG